MKLLVLSISTNLTTLRLSSSTLRVSISLRVSSVSLPTSTNLSSATILTATSILVSMWNARQTFPYSPLPRQEVSVQFSTIFTMTVNRPLLKYSIIIDIKIPMIQLLVVLVLLLLVHYVAAQETAPVHAVEKYYIFSQECFETFFSHHDWLNVFCLKKTLVKLLGYGVVAGATIVKVPQILKIIKKKSTFGVSFASVTLESFTQLSAVAYNISRENPFSVYGETLLIAIQCVVIHLLFIIYSDKKSGGRIYYIATLIVVLAVFYAALNPAYFPQYIIQNAMIAQIILFSGARLLQIFEIHRVKSTGSLSEITCGLVVLGNLSRLGTALVEVADDYLYKYSVINALVLNGYILLSFLIFRTKAAKPQEKKQ